MQSDIKLYLCIIYLCRKKKIAYKHTIQIYSSFQITSDGGKETKYVCEIMQAAFVREIM